MGFCPDCGNHIHRQKNSSHSLHNILKQRKRNSRFRASLFFWPYLSIYMYTANFSLQEKQTQPLQNRSSVLDQKDRRGDKFSGYCEWGLSLSQTTPLHEDRLSKQCEFLCFSRASHLSRNVSPLLQCFFALLNALNYGHHIKIHVFLPFSLLVFELGGVAWIFNIITEAQGSWDGSRLWPKSHKQNRCRSSWLGSSLRT
jgi:hypothetical protein